MTDIRPPAGNTPPRNIAAQALSSLVPHRSAGLKLLLVCFLALVMAVPAMFMYDIVRERTLGQETAFNEVAERVGGHQSVLGPVLALPYAHTPNPNKSSRVTYGVAIAYAETGTVDSKVTVSERTRGIHGIPVYNASMDFAATFAPESLRQALPENAEPIWADARLYLGVSDARGIKDAINVTAGGRTISLEPVASRDVNDVQYQIQTERFKHLEHIHYNAQMGPKQLDRFCKLNNDSVQLIKTAMDRLNLSARAYDRILRVARTIADLEENKALGTRHVAEAIQYRSLDREM